MRCSLRLTWPFKWSYHFRKKEQLKIYPSKLKYFILNLNILNLVHCDLNKKSKNLKTPNVKGCFHLFNSTQNLAVISRTNMSLILFSWDLPFLSSRGDSHHFVAWRSVRMLYGLPVCVPEGLILGAYYGVHLSGVVLVLALNETFNT